MQMTRRLMITLSAAAVTLSPVALTHADPLRPVDPVTRNLVNKLPPSWDGKKVAVRGRDVVSEGTAKRGLAKGSKKYTAEYDNTTWRFESAKNRDLFLENPERYVPEFGGYCPVALASGKAKIGRTNQFTRIDNKLYLNYNARNRENFASTPEDYIVRAQVNW